MKCSAICHIANNNHLELSIEQGLSQKPYLVLMEGQIFRTTINDEMGKNLNLPQESVEQGNWKNGQEVNVWIEEENSAIFQKLSTSFKEALMANEKACYFYLLLDPVQQCRYQEYVEIGEEKERIRRINKVLSMLYEHIAM